MNFSMILLAQYAIYPMNKKQQYHSQYAKTYIQFVQNAQIKYSSLVPFAKNLYFAPTKRESTLKSFFKIKIKMKEQQYNKEKQQTTKRLKKSIHRKLQFYNQYKKYQQLYNISHNSLQRQEQLIKKLTFDLQQIKQKFHNEQFHNKLLLKQIQANKWEYKILSKELEQIYKKGKINRSRAKLSYLENQRIISSVRRIILEQNSFKQLQKQQNQLDLNKKQ